MSEKKRLGLTVDRLDSSRFLDKNASSILFLFTLEDVESFDKEEKNWGILYIGIFNSLSRSPIIPFYR